MVEKGILQVAIVEGPYVILEPLTTGLRTQNIANRKDCLLIKCIYVCPLIIYEKIGQINNAVNDFASQEVKNQVKHNIKFIQIAHAPLRYREKHVKIYNNESWRLDLGVYSPTVGIEKEIM